MEKASSSTRSSAYLNALTQEIEKKLQRAKASASQSRNVLQELFADLALEVDDRARDIILSREEDAIAPAEDSVHDQLCFYNVLADYYLRMPENGKRILDLIVQLWSQSFASHVFSLLFHKWLFEAQLDNSEVLVRYSSALMEGATNVFWIDIQTNARRFQTLFQYLLEGVALEPKRLNKIPGQAQRDLFLLLSRFILFYNSADKLDSLLAQFPIFPNAFLVGGPADFFVIEVADQLQKLKVEPVLLHYLSQIKVLQGMELRMTTSTRLKACLYSFTSPGGPMYPTRAVRHAAWGALDFLFPVGRYPRHLISLFLLSSEMKISRPYRSLSIFPPKPRNVCSSTSSTVTDGGDNDTTDSHFVTIVRQIVRGSQSWKIAFNNPFIVQKLEPHLNVCLYMVLVT